MDTTVTIQQSIGGFLASHTESSASTYRTPLNHFRSFLAECGLVVEQECASALTVDHAIHFVGWLRDRVDPAKATLETYLTAVYRFYRHLLKRGADLSAADLARLEEVYKDARNIRGESRPIDHTLAAVQAVIAAARSIPVRTGPDAGRRNLARLRNIAIVETLRATGCRRAELAGLRLNDLDPEAKSAQVKGKGSKYRWVYLDNTAWLALGSYLKARRVQAESNAALFVGHGNNSNGAQLSARHVGRIVQVLAERAGVHVYPHYFRHVFATRALDKTENLAVVQDLMGHASPATTRVYAKTDENQRRTAHRAIWE